MKYIVILMDGAADTKVSELGDKTPLEVAKNRILTDWHL